MNSMLYEIWIKGDKSILVSCSDNNEYRYRFDGRTHYISGMSFFSLTNDGWKRDKVLKEIR